MTDTNAGFSGLHALAVVGKLSGFIVHGVDEGVGEFVSVGPRL